LVLPNCQLKVTCSIRIIRKQRDLLKPIVESHNGEWFKEIGDELLLSFETNLDAVECAIKIQHQVKSVEHLNLRIGIRQGEVVFQGSNVIGDDVNMASLIEPFSTFLGRIV
jgi:class 3 adenylate cyclase